MHDHETLDYANSSLHQNSSKITLRNIIFTPNDKDYKSKTKAFKVHHFQYQACMIIFDHNSDVLPNSSTHNKTPN